VTDIHRGHEDFYGQMKYHTVSYEGASLFIFPVDRYGSTSKQTLAFKVVQPYDHNALASSVERFLSDTFGRPPQIEHKA
jgi:hypothetical protein